jgi:hypothetical protein
MNVGEQQPDAETGFEDCEGGVGIHGFNRNVTGVFHHIDRPHAQENLVFNDENSCRGDGVVQDHHASTSAKAVRLWRVADPSAIGDHFTTTTTIKSSV